MGTYSIRSKIKESPLKRNFWGTDHFFLLEKVFVRDFESNFRSHRMGWERVELGEGEG